MKSSGKAARVFSVSCSESRSSSRVAGSIDHVLQDGAEAARRGVDVRLVDVRQADGLGVAAALEVEDASGRPAVLVVADEGALRVGGERRLARAREAEEDGHVAVARRR